MYFTKSPFVYLSIGACLMCFALGLLPSISSSAVHLGDVAAAEPVAEAVEQPASEEVVWVAEVMPLWPGSENGTSYASRKALSDKLMLEYIYANLKYPEEAQEAGAEGMAVVQFTVMKDGSVSNIHLIRDPGYGMGEAAAEVVQQFNTDGIFWYPGRSGGQPVNVQYNLPVRFKL